jgi:hypothetical protein
MPVLRPQGEGCELVESIGFNDTSTVRPATFEPSGIQDPWSLGLAVSVGRIVFEERHHTDLAAQRAGGAAAPNSADRQRQDTTPAGRTIPWTDWKDRLDGAPPRLCPGPSLVPLVNQHARERYSAKSEEDNRRYGREPVAGIENKDEEASG